MDLIEPQRVFERRYGLASASGPPAPPQPRPARPLRDDFWTETIFDVLRDYGDEPMRFTSLVNVTVDAGNFSTRAGREAKKIELFRLIGRLVREKRLSRVGRQHICIARPDARHPAHVEAVAQALNLPPPRV
jgi:hypothetical protein